MSYPGGTMSGGQCPGTMSRGDNVLHSSARPVSAQNHQKWAMRGPPMDGHHQKSASNMCFLRDYFSDGIAYL